MRRLSGVSAVAIALAAQAALGQVAVGIKNFNQLLASYVAVTGVPASDPDITAYFAQAKTRLPKQGRPDEFSSTGLLAASALGGLFCQKLIAADAALAAPQRRAEKQVDFTLAPAAALTAAVRTATITEYARMFWQRAPTAAEAGTLNGVFDAAVAAGGTTPADTPAVLLPVCATVAMALDSLTN